MSKKYFVIDQQGTGWKEGQVWNSVKEIADSIRVYDDFQDLENADTLSHSAVIELWGFEYHRLTPSNYLRYGIKPSDFTEVSA